MGEVRIQRKLRSQELGIQGLSNVGYVRKDVEREEPCCPGCLMGRCGGTDLGCRG